MVGPLGIGISLWPRTAGGGAGPGPEQKNIILLGTHGDSETVDIYLNEAEDVNFDNVWQYRVGTDTLDPEIFPTLWHPVGGGAQINRLSKTHYLAKSLVELGYYVVIHPGGWNGAAVWGPNPEDHSIGPLPDGVTAYNVDAFEKMLIKAQATWPDDNIIPVIVVADSGNGSITNNDYLVAKMQQLEDLRTAAGWEDAPIVQSSMYPEHMDTAPGSIRDAAVRTAALRTSDTIYMQMPRGHCADNLHAGPQDKIRALGRNEFLRGVLVAIGVEEPAVPVSSTPNPILVEAGSDTPISLAFDQPVYITGINDGDDIVELSGDIELAYQVLRPVGGAWPATAGEHLLEIGVRSGERWEGVLARTIDVQEPTVSFTIVSENTGEAPVNLAVTEGKTYIVAGWGGAGLVVGGVVTPSIVENTGSGNRASFFEYVATSSGMKTFTPTSSMQMQWIIETDLVFNESEGAVAPGAPTGSFGPTGSLNDHGLAMVLSGGGAPSINMTLLATIPNFYLYTSPSTVTPEGSFPSGYNGFLGIGLSPA